MEKRRIAVLGSGSYGTCLAVLLSEKGHDVSLWCRTESTAEAIREARENTKYLAGFTLEPSVRVTSDLVSSVAEAEFVLGVTPSHAVREVFKKIAPHLGKDTVVVNASKGVEQGTLARVDEIYSDVLPADVAGRATFLSGPTFAREVASGAPSAIVIASRSEQAGKAVQQTFSTEKFRVYTSDDVIGVQVGGALKNIVAICAGISDGLGFGDNARAAIITRGLAEITRMGVAVGANALTFAGLSGMGDLVLTCAGDQSRNRRVGLALGGGKTLAAVTESMGGMVAEGVKTTKAARNLAIKVKVDAPLTEFAYRVLYEDVPAREGIRDLLSRSLKAERG